jgi:hypothetical protein
MKNINRLTDCFYAGKYREVIADLGPNLIPVNEPDFEIQTFLQIGSLVFLGQPLEAQSIFDLSLKKITPSELFLCRCRFFLGVGAIRTSAYKKASRFFAISLHKYKKERPLSAEIKFYTLQGAAFFKYFKGQYRQSSQYAQLAYVAALEMQQTYTQILSLDLLGHSLCQIGDVRHGLLELEKATQLANQLGNGGILVALQFSLIKYQAQFGIDLKCTIENLQNALQVLQPQDTYSKAELSLELSRQLMLRGNREAAQKYLESASSLIYRHENRRQSAILNLRFAYLLFLKGEAVAALTLTQSLRNNLDASIDRAILCQVVGLENKIDFFLNRQSREIKEQTSAVTFVDSRIQHRETKKHFYQKKVGDDPLGDIIDLVDRDQDEAFDKIKEFGLYGLLPRLLNIPIGTKSLYLGPHRRNLVIVDGGDVSFIEQGITASLRRLIYSLAGPEFKSKQLLVQKVWNYHYNPIVHDSILYAAIGKLRKFFGGHASWIEWSSDGYRLRPEIKVQSYEYRLTEPHHASTNDVKALQLAKKITPSQISNFNIRQLQFVKHLKPDEVTSVRGYMKKYKVCSMTAFRDLAALHRGGQLIRIGKGRGTVYQAAVSSENFYES